MGAPEQHEAMLSGLTSFGDSMFAGMGQADKYKLVPDPGEMRARMDAAQVVRRADLKCVMVRSYDLSEEKDALQYCKDREWILMGMAMNTHRLVHHDKQFVEGMNPPRWIAHMEWMEFELTETPVAPVGTTEE